MSEFNTIANIEDCFDNFTVEEFADIWCAKLQEMSSFIEDDRLEFVQRKFLDNACYVWHSAIEFTEKTIQDRARKLQAMIRQDRGGDEIYDQKVENLTNFIVTLQQQMVLYEAMLAGAEKANPGWRPAAQRGQAPTQSGAAFEAHKLLEGLKTSMSRNDPNADVTETYDRTRAANGPHPDENAS